MSNLSNDILEAALIGHAKTVYDPAPALILRSVSVAHVIIDGEEAVVTVTTGDPANWETLGLLAYANSELSGEVAGEAARALLSDDDDEADDGPVGACS